MVHPKGLETYLLQKTKVKEVKSLKKLGLDFSKTEHQNIRVLIVFFIEKTKVF